jgi:hypothetical protein
MENSQTITTHNFPVGRRTSRKYALVRRFRGFFLAAKKKKGGRKFGMKKGVRRCKKNPT